MCQRQGQLIEPVRESPSEAGLAAMNNGISTAELDIWESGCLDIAGTVPVIVRVNLRTRQVLRVVVIDESFEWAEDIGRAVFVGNESIGQKARLVSLAEQAQEIADAADYWPG